MLIPDVLGREARDHHAQLQELRSCGLHVPQADLEHTGDPRRLAEALAVAFAAPVVHAPQQVPERGGHEYWLRFADQHREEPAWNGELPPVIGHAGEEVTELAGFIHGNFGQTGWEPGAPRVPPQQADPLQPPD